MIARVFSAAGNAAPRAPVRNLGACTSFSRFRCAPLAEWREVNSLPLLHAALAVAQRRWHRADELAT
jgi:hypothetical protein